MWEFYRLDRGVTWLDMSLLTGVYLNLDWNLLPFNLLKATLGLGNLLHWPCDVFDHMTVIIELVIKEKIILWGLWDDNLGRGVVKSNKARTTTKITTQYYWKKGFLIIDIYKVFTNCMIKYSYIDIFMWLSFLFILQTPFVP